MTKSSVCIAISAAALIWALLPAVCGICGQEAGDGFICKGGLRKIDSARSRAAVCEGVEVSSPARFASVSQGAKPMPSPTASFIGNKGSRKIHRSSCPWGRKISPGKIKCFQTYEEAKAEGYVPCKTCHPDRPPTATPRP